MIHCYSNIPTEDSLFKWKWPRTEPSCKCH